MNSRDYWSAVCLSFLCHNGVRLRANDDELVALVLETISGVRTKSDVAVVLAVSGQRDPRQNGEERRAALRAVHRSPAKS